MNNICDPSNPNIQVDKLHYATRASIQLAHAGLQYRCPRSRRPQKPAKVVPEVADNQVLSLVCDEAGCNYESDHVLPQNEVVADSNLNNNAASDIEDIPLADDVESTKQSTDQTSCQVDHESVAGYHEKSFEYYGIQPCADKVVMVVRDDIERVSPSEESGDDSGEESGWDDGNGNQWFPERDYSRYRNCPLILENSF